jgi:hypothetical protein
VLSRILATGKLFVELVDCGRSEEEARSLLFARNCENLQKQGAPHDEAEYVSFLVVSLGCHWARSAFATVVLGHKLAASFCATTIPKEHVPDVSLPWPCFRIRVPENVLNISSIWIWRGTAQDLKNEGNEDGLCSLSYNDKKNSLSTSWNKSLGDHSDFENIEFQKLGNGLRNSNDINIERETLLCHRLTIGVCLELATHRCSHEIDKQRKNRRTSSEPTVWTYTLGRNVKVDARPYVAAFLRGDLRSVNVQSLVRGHYKMQAFGPQLSDRRLIHIEPYWRGPEDAPIVVRGHIL